MNEEKNKIKELPFETIMANLEKTVSLLESGEMSLENSLKAYEKGIGLVRMAEERLKSMEAKIEELTQGKKVPLEVDL
jgi:exodeoxyribonuclease VII small subunit